MRPLVLTDDLCDAIFSEARAAYPREACGVVLGIGPKNMVFFRYDNLADRRHALDPIQFPRDGRVSYVLNSLKLERQVETARASGEDLLAIVHSHPDHPSYLSATDRAAAAPFGSPSWPDAAQIVVSVFGGEVRDLKAFGWDPAASEWIELEVMGVPELPGPPAGAVIYGEV